MALACNIARANSRYIRYGGQHSSSRHTDISAITVGAYTAGELLHRVSTQAGVGADRARQRAVQGRLDARRQSGAINIVQVVWIGFLHPARRTLSALHPHARYCSRDVASWSNARTQFTMAEPRSTQV